MLAMFGMFWFFHQSLRLKSFCQSDLSFYIFIWSCVASTPNCWSIKTDQYAYSHNHFVTSPIATVDALEPVDLALSRPAMQNGTINGSKAGLAVDGSELLVTNPITCAISGGCVYVTMHKYLLRLVKTLFLWNIVPLWPSG